jgi:hypothetical protein
MCLLTANSGLGKTRARLPLEAHEAVFAWVLERLAEHGLIRGERIGVDASTMEANAALRAIVRRDTGEGYRAMLERPAAESGIATPTAEDLVRLDRERKGKRLSNAEWASPSDPEARIAKLKDGRTRLAYKPEHAVDLDSGAIVAAEVHAADRGDTATLPETLAAAEANLAAVGAAPTPENPSELVAGKGYHSREGLKGLEDGAWKSRIPEKKAAGVSRWRGGAAARRRGGRCTTTAPGCARASLVRRSSAGPSCASAASPWCSTAAGCAGHGCAAARTCASATWCTSPATISGWSCASWSARAPRGSSWPGHRPTCSPSRRPMAPCWPSSSSPPRPRPRCSSSASSRSRTAEAGFRQRAARPRA